MTTLPFLPCTGTAMMERMEIDRGFLRETVVACDVDVSSGVAGQTDCFECGGDGNWGKFAPEIVGADFQCVECKGTGKVWVSI